MKSIHAPTLVPLLLRRLQVQLNRWIAQSTAAQEEMRALEDQSLIIEITQTSWRIQLGIEQQQARLRTADYEAVADIEIKASAFELLRMLRARSPAEFSAGDIEFRGNLRTAERFSQMLRLACPQVEDELAAWLGGTPARAAVRAGSAVHLWGTRTAGALEQNAAEYLQAESRELPRPAELEDYLVAVEDLRNAVDRLSQRIDRLAGRETAQARAAEKA